MPELNTDVIHTERLVLSIASPVESAEVLAYRLRNRPHLQKWEPKREEAYYTLEATEKQMTNWRKAFEDKEALSWLIHLRGDDSVIGSCSFACPIRGVHQSIHLGFSIGAEFQGQGLMQEALKAAIAYAFEQEGYHRIMAYYIPHNARSGQLLAKLGFEREGYARDYVKINGKWEDHILTSLLNPADKQ